MKTERTYTPDQLRKIYAGLEMDTINTPKGFLEIFLYIENDLKDVRLIGLN